MLNAQDIAKRIALPSLSTKEDQDDLNQLAKEYPYSQIFSILYLKALKQSKDVRFEEELKAHSFRIADRTQLYYLIHQENTETETTIEQESLPETNIPVEKQETTPVKEGSVENVPSINEEIVTKELPASNEKSPEISESVDSGDGIVDGTLEVEPREEQSLNDISETVTPTENEETSHEEEQDVVENKTDTERSHDPLEETILHHAYAANYRLDELTEEEKKQLSKQSIPPVTEPKEEIESEHQSPLIEERSFTSWFDVDKNFVEPVVEENDQIKLVVTQFKEFDPTNDLFGEIEKPKKEFFSATQKGKTSLAEEGLPVSETLAKVYEMQGNYPKAISAYEQLSLINSEKRTYFASLIEKLKKKLNSE